MKIIIVPLGNTCTTSYILNKRGISHSQLFAKIPSTPQIIYDCFDTDFLKFIDFSNQSTDFAEMDLLNKESKFIYKEKSNIINYYKIFFPHKKTCGVTSIINIIKDQIKEFKNILLKNQNIIFIYINGIGMMYDKFLEYQDMHHQYLTKIEELLITKYKLKNFKIIAFNINKEYLDTTHIQNHKIEWTTTNPKNYQEYMQSLKTFTLMCEKMVNKIIK